MNVSILCDTFLLKRIISSHSSLLSFKTSSYTFWKWLLILFPYLLCWEQMTFEFTSQMILSKFHAHE